MGHTLVSWLGKTDLRAVTESKQVGLGPIAQALQTARFFRLELLCDCSEEEAGAFLAWLKTQAPTDVAPHYVTLSSPMDFGERYFGDPVAACRRLPPNWLWRRVAVIRIGCSESARRDCLRYSPRAVAC